MPGVRADTRRRGARGHGARTEDTLRSLPGRRRAPAPPGNARGEPRGRPARPSEPALPHRGTEGLWRGAEGATGAVELARLVIEAASEPNSFHHLYNLDLPLVEKIEKIATEIY